MPEVIYEEVILREHTMYLADELSKALYGKPLGPREGTSMEVFHELLDEVRGMIASWEKAHREANFFRQTVEEVREATENYERKVRHG